MRVWVDTDFGFDDLWALLLLDHLNISVDGVSLVAGNTPMPQVIKNANASLCAFGFNWPVFKGAAKPLHRKLETAERILGQFGMCSRGLYLPYHALNTGNQVQNASAIDAMADWLQQDDTHHIIALGPLTNLATLLLQHPDATSKINQITWLGGSRGRGNHTQYAEYNALADPEALSIVTGSNIPFRMIDLALCRQVTYSETDTPIMQGNNHQLLTDLLGGYLDIALQRGRTAMSIYDPLAALSFAKSELIKFTPASLIVNTEQGAEYGRTIIDIAASEGSANVEIATSIDAVSARNICLSALLYA